MQTNSYINKEVYYRLIALWVLCEAMLGGIIHGFKIPVSGLIVGSCAVICICLIAWYVPAKGSVMKATIIVAIFKMMLSPQAPPPAYIAVFFPGLTGGTFILEQEVLPGFMYSISGTMFIRIGIAAHNYAHYYI